ALGKQRRKSVIDRLDERRHRAEVSGQLQRLQPDRADSTIARPQKQSYLRFPELINRLHGVADDEQRAAITLLPTCRQHLNQIELRERGVLKLIHQDVS